MDVDVVVAGAGPTGLMLAGELALAGVRVLVLERREAPQRDSRALSLHPRSVELMDLRGIAEGFLARGQPVPGWHFAGLPTGLNFADLDSPHPYSLFLAQSHTEELLAARTAELGVRPRRGHAVTGLRQDVDSVEVEVRGPDGDYLVRAGFVVGCDGGRSVVRQAGGIGFPGSDSTFSAMLGDFAVAGPAAVRRAGEHGVLAAPLGDGVTRFVLPDAERMRVPVSEPVTEAEFLAALRRATGSTLGVARPRWLSRFGNATRLADRYRHGRVLVAGDAAHIHFPAAGQGLNVGLQDAMNLGWKLAAEIKGWAPAGLLDSYHAERHPVGQRVVDNTMAQTLLLELMLMPEYRRPVAALRAVLDDLLGIEEVNLRLAGGISALDTRYGTAAEPLVGARMPDVVVGEGRRVYELVRDGRFVLLDFAGDGEVAGWADRVRGVRARMPAGHPALAGVRAVLVRPDGHVAWVSRAETGAGREQALREWVGAPAAVVA
ncbi:FAD-dependent monooxygenase [Crossiella sp. CA198]|uniref:FAD-dependent monooxygenase n=1 Tax=Crossiella sp. CA198 TaxID=3455607 RepID=UPI003F8D56AE